MGLELNNSGRTRSAFIATIVACAVLQVALAPQISLFGGRFNFMLVLTASLAISGDSRALVYIGFFSGLFYDLTTTSPVGFMALLLAVMGYAVALMSRGLSSGLGMQTVRVVVLAVIAVNLLYGLGLFFMGIESNVLISVGVHGLASSLLDLIACVPLLILGGQGGAHGRSGRGRRGLSYGGTRYKGLR